MKYFLNSGFILSFVSDKHTITKNEVSITNQISEYREVYYFFPLVIRIQRTFASHKRLICINVDGSINVAEKQSSSPLTFSMFSSFALPSPACQPLDDPTEGSQ